jgi:prevent-host-death family protein
MPKTPKIIPISDLRQNASDVVKGVSSSGGPVFITQRGRAAAVMVSMQVYEESQHELDILRLLARGEKEIESGIGYELDEVLGEADRELHATLKRAATLQNRTITDFVITAIQEAAENVIQQTEVLRLSLADQKHFAQALLSPPKAAPALGRAFARHRELVSGE